MKKFTGALLLLIASLIWGSAFVAQTSAADSIGTFTFNASRSVLAAIFLSIVLTGRKIISKPVQNADKASVSLSVLGGSICGAVLFLAMLLQQSGIAAYPPEAAASGRAGFLTATYVVMIPCVQRITGKKLPLPVIIAVFGCITGMYLLCMSGGFGGIYLGDLLELLCAAGFTAHILTIDHFGKIDGIVLSFIQFCTCGILSAIGMLIFEHPDINTILAAWLPIAYAGILSSGVAYTLQIIGQKTAEPSVASIIMSLESVFAALFGWLILGEMLSIREFIGCGLVFISVICAQIPDLVKSKEKNTVQP